MLIAVSLARRKVFDGAAFQRWLSDLDAEQKVWHQSPPREDMLQTFENNTYMLQALAAHLSPEPESPQIGGARVSVLKVLQRR